MAWQSFKQNAPQTANALRWVARSSTTSIACIYICKLYGPRFSLGGAFLEYVGMNMAYYDYVCTTCIAQTNGMFSPGSVKGNLSEYSFHAAHTSRLLLLNRHSIRRLSHHCRASQHSKKASSMGRAPTNTTQGPIPALDREPILDIAKCVLLNKRRSQAWYNFCRT